MKTLLFLNLILMLTGCGLDTNIRSFSSVVNPAKPSFTATGTAVPTSTSTVGPTGTVTATATATSTIVPTVTSTATPTHTFTSIPTHTFTSIPTHTFTSIPTATHTFTFTPTATYTFTSTPTATYTFTSTPTPTFTFTATHTPTPTFTFTATHTPTPTFTPTPMIVYHIELSNLPSIAQTNTVFTSQPVAVIKNQYGAVKSSDNSTPISLSAFKNSTCSTPATGIITATQNPKTVSSGIANFVGAKYNKAESIYIKASASGATSSCVGPILVKAPVVCSRDVMSGYDAEVFGETWNIASRFAIPSIANDTATMDCTKVNTTCPVLANPGTFAQVQLNRAVSGSIASVEVDVDSVLDTKNARLKITIGKGSQIYMSCDFGFKGPGSQTGYGYASSYGETCDQPAQEQFVGGPGDAVTHSFSQTLSLVILDDGPRNVSCYSNYGSGSSLAGSTSSATILNSTSGLDVQVILKGNAGDKVIIKDIRINP